MTASERLEHAVVRARSLLSYAEMLERRALSGAGARLEALAVINRARRIAEPDDLDALDALALRCRAPAQSVYG